MDYFEQKGEFLMNQDKQINELSTEELYRLSLKAILSECNKAETSFERNKALAKSKEIAETVLAEGSLRAAGNSFYGEEST